MRPRPAAKLACTGAVVGTACDALHNQAILVYDRLPVRLDLGVGTVCTSLLVPVLLAVAYSVIGGVLPRLTAGIEGGRPILGGRSRRERALLAVLSTACIIRASEALASAPLGPSAALLLLLAAAQWAVLDGSLATLALASIVSVGGPLAELPFLYTGVWHYTQPNLFPLELLGVLSPSDPAGAWAGLDLLTFPCYFAVCTDAVALGSWYGSGEGGEAEEELGEPPD